MKATYKEFGKYLRAVADMYAKYGDAPLEVEKEYNKLHDALCQMHNDFDHGAARIEELKDIFVVQCEDYGQGWFDPKNNK